MQDGRVGKRKRLPGGGDKPLSDELEKQVFEWVQDQLRRGLRVSIRSVQESGKHIFTSIGNLKPFSASRGWAKRFMKRNGLTVRKRTTIAQKDPEQLFEKLVNFVIYTSHARATEKISAANIIAMDETSLWFDIISNTTVETVGAKSVSLKSTGNEKAHATVILSAKGDGTKLQPYIVFKQAIREVKALSTTKQAIVVSSRNGWMNDELTKDWLDRIYGKFAFAKRALVWDSYRCHISEATKTHFAKFNSKMLVIPGGCTKYIQAPDVSWNKPFKAHLAVSYDKWLSNNESKNYTRGGNLKAPPKSVLVEWVKEAWNSIPTELIKKSFKACALTINIDGSEDDEIMCFKKGQPCHEARDLLKIHRLDNRISELQLEEDPDEIENNELIIDADFEEETNIEFTDYASDNDNA